MEGVRSKKVTWFLLVWDPISQGTQLQRAFAPSGSAGAGASVGGGVGGGPAEKPVERCSKCNAKAKR